MLISVEATIEKGYGAAGYGESGYGEPSSDELALEATAGPISTDGTVRLAVWGTALDRITVTGLWTDWTVTNYKTAGAAFTDAIDDEGAVHFEWAERATDVELSLTFELPERYVGGEFAIAVSGLDGADSARAEVTIDLGR